MAIGKGHTELREATLCIGKCTSPQRGNGIFGPGCPPVGSQILAAICGGQSVDDTDARGKKRAE